jgi:hypothetical protein
MHRRTRASGILLDAERDVRLNRRTQRLRTATGTTTRSSTSTRRKSGPSLIRRSMRSQDATTRQLAATSTIAYDLRIEETNNLYAIRSPRLPHIYNLDMCTCECPPSLQTTCSEPFVLTRGMDAHCKLVEAIDAQSYTGWGSL